METFSSVTKVCRYLQFLLFLAGLCLFSQSEALAQSAVNIHAIKITGAERTSLTWLQDYIDLDLPAAVTKLKMDNLKRRLLATLVFKEVEVYLDDDPAGRVLCIDLEEKWTAIPVVRGAYGGGIPFKVLGAYDTHLLGSLLTLGVQAEQYGSEPVGGVFWIKSPKFDRGRSSLGLELWKINRQRAIYDSDLQVGSIVSSREQLRGYYLRPAPFGFFFSWGLDFTIEKKKPTVIDDPKNQFQERYKSEGSRENLRYSLKLPIRYDLIDTYNLHMDGIKSTLSLGYSTENQVDDYNIESETFYFKKIDGYSELAAHLFIGSSTRTDADSLYYLSGLTSVRGLLDSSIYGNEVLYSNVEFRTLSYKARYAWLQTVVFSDYGRAGKSISNESDYKSAYSYGAGIRIAIPQVYRLVFRIDYAFTEGDIKSQGISAGLNQFFQPYKPL
jgi:outer membrane protein assembly factor BamA